MHTYVLWCLCICAVRRCRLDNTWRTTVRRLMRSIKTMKVQAWRNVKLTSNKKSAVNSTEGSHGVLPRLSRYSKNSLSCIWCMRCHPCARMCRSYRSSTIKIPRVRMHYTCISNRTRWSNYISEQLSNRRHYTNVRR